MRILRVGVCVVFAGCALFPSLGDLTGGDAATPADAGDGAAIKDGPTQDVVVATDSGNDSGPIDAGSDAATCGFAGPTAGLIAYYPFEEGAGSTIHDCSPNHYNGTFVQQATNTWTTGKHGGAILVQNTNGCVDLGTHAAFQPTVLSLSVWVNVNAWPSPGASGYIVGQSFLADTDGWRYASRQTDAGSFLDWEHTNNSTRYYVDTPGPAVSTWHHAAVTFVNGTMQIFIDGTLSKTQSSMLPIVYDAAPLRIGCRADGANSFDGMIDEVRLYNRALTQTEISQLAQ